MVAFTPVLMQHPKNPELQETASTPAELAQLEWDGWRKVGTPPVSQTSLQKLLSYFTTEGKVKEVALPARLSQTELRAASGTVARQAAVSAAGTALGNTLVKIGVVLDKGAPGDFDSEAVESLSPFHDPESGRIGGVYTGYGLNADGKMVASIGLAYSDDGISWEKAGQLIGGSGIDGSPDKAGCTGPLIIWHGGIYYLFRIGLTEVGYEAGLKQVVVSSTPSLANPAWTHHGVALAPNPAVSWRSDAVWHANIVEWKGRPYCFINATSSDGKERIGYAVSTWEQFPLGWVFDDVNSPLLEGGEYDFIAGDPHVRKTPDGWRMDYFTAWAEGAYDWYTTTTEEAFPLGWKPHDGNDTRRMTIAPGPPGSYDSFYAHKPIIFHQAGRLLHYYTAVMAGGTNRRVALAIDPAAYGYATNPIPEVAAARTTTGTMATMATSTIMFPSAGRRGLEMRLAIRGNPGATATMSVRVLDRPDSAVTLVGNGDPNNWQNAAGPWVPVPDGDIFFAYLQWTSSDGTPVTFGNGSVEFRWVDI